MNYGQRAKIPYFKLTRIELTTTREKSLEITHRFYTNGAIGQRWEA
jgi:hypothetical protein